MNTVKWFATVFVASLGIGSGAGIAAIATAAPGDLIYKIGGHQVSITAPQAACFADCAIAAGTWDGARADMVKTCAYRTDEGFAGFTVGIKTAAPGDLPVQSGPVQVLGIVEE